MTALRPRVVLEYCRKFGLQGLKTNKKLLYLTVLVLELSGTIWTHGKMMFANSKDGPSDARCISGSCDLQVGAVVRRRAGTAQVQFTNRVIK